MSSSLLSYGTGLVVTEECSPHSLTSVGQHALQEFSTELFHHLTQTLRGLTHHTVLQWYKRMQKREMLVKGLYLNSS